MSLHWCVGGGGGGGGPTFERDFEVVHHVDRRKTSNSIDPPLVYGRTYAWACIQLTVLFAAPEAVESSNASIYI